MQRWLWELPAGTVDDGETPEAAARRECHEEIGARARDARPPGCVSIRRPGYCDEEMVFFRASGLSEPSEAAAVDEDEDIEPKTFSIADAREMIRRGEITDMKTVVGLGLI